MLQNAVISALIMLCIPIMCIVTEIILNKFFNCSSAETMYCILPVSIQTEDIEIRLITLSNQLKRMCNENYTVYIVDFGAEKSVLDICEKYCSDNDCFVLIEPQSLCVLLNPVR